MPSTLPPRGHYEADVAPLRALINGEIQPAHLALWHLVRAYDWDGSGCPHDDGELATLLGYTRRYVRSLRADLERAGLLDEQLSGRQRLLSAAPPSRGRSRHVIHTQASSQQNVDKPREKPPGRKWSSYNHRNSGSALARTTAVAVKSVKAAAKSLSLGKGGLGENRNGSSAPETGFHPLGEADLAALVQQWSGGEIKASPAADIARRALAERVSSDQLRRRVEQVLAQYPGKVGLAVTILREDPLVPPATPRRTEAENEFLSFMRGSGDDQAEQ